MKIGINLVGVSYNDGTYGRYRNYQDAIDNFYKYIVNPLRDDGHEVVFYIFTYDSIKRDEIIDAYQPLIRQEFTHPTYNSIGGGDVLPNGIKMISATDISSLKQLLTADLDLVISTRFDINFFKNPFEEYQYDFTKCNFLWREPEFTDLPIVNDTFIVFPHSMTQNLIDTIIEMELNPPHGVNVAMHNIYLPMINQVGKDNVQWVCDEFVNTINNTLYKLMRHE
jgi:hypothetical protein